MVVPLVVREQCLGELMLGSRKPEFFNAYDLQVVTTAAGQLASALESAYLVSQTDENLRTRVDQLTAIMRISRELNASLDVNKLLELVHTESINITNAECGSILLFERSGAINALEVQFSIGCLVDEHILKMLSEVNDIDNPLVIKSFEQNEFPAPHDNVRSALVVPIRKGGNLAGVIYLHANQPDFFKEDIVELVKTLAIHASIALNTASQYQAEYQRAELLRRRAETISSLTEISYAVNFEQPIEQQLRTIGNAICTSTPFQAALFSVYEPDTGLLRRVTGIGFSQDVLAELLAHKQPLVSIQKLLIPEFRISRSYLIPANDTPIVPADIHMVTLDLDEFDHAENAWDQDDFLLVP